MSKIKDSIIAEQDNIRVEEIDFSPRSKWKVDKAQKEKKFATDRLLRDKLNCRHKETELTQFINHERDDVEFYETCKFCNKII